MYKYYVRDSGFWKRYTWKAGRFAFCIWDIVKWTRFFNLVKSLFIKILLLWYDHIFMIPSFYFTLLHIIKKTSRRSRMVSHHIISYRRHHNNITAMMKCVYAMLWYYSWSPYNSLLLWEAWIEYLSFFHLSWFLYILNAGKNHVPIHFEREDILRITSGVINKSVYCQETRYTAFIFFIPGKKPHLKKSFLSPATAGKLGTFMGLTITVAFEQQLWERD